MSNVTLSKMPYFNSPDLFPSSGSVFLRLGRTWGKTGSFVKSVGTKTTPKKFLGIELWRSRSYEVEKIPVKEKAVKILLDSLSLPRDDFKSQVAYLGQKFSQIIPQDELSELLQASSVKEPQSWYAETVLKKGRAYKALSKKLLETNDLWVEITSGDEPFRAIQDRQEIGNILNEEIRSLKLGLTFKYTIPLLTLIVSLGSISLNLFLGKSNIYCNVGFFGLLATIAFAKCGSDMFEYNLQQTLSEMKNLKMMGEEP